MGWKMFVEEADVLLMKSILLRTSDNVLDEKDWSITRITLEEGIITNIEMVMDGVYSQPNLKIGMTAADIAKWTCYDPTGQHPEVYHEVLIDLFLGHTMRFPSFKHTN